MSALRRVLRWGRSSYESDANLEEERSLVESLGLDWSHTIQRPDAETLARADVLLVTSGVHVDAATLGMLAGGYVLTTTSGFDHIDVSAAKRFGIQVARCPLARRDAVVEWTVGHLTVLMRRASCQWDASRQGSWSRGDLPLMGIRPVSGAQVVVVGCGVIGARVRDVLRHMGAQVRVVDPRFTDASERSWVLEKALVGADAVTLHCALNDSSRYLLDASALQRLPPHAVVLNSARGLALDFACAVERVQAGSLGGLAVDVFPDEPLTADRLAVVHDQVLLTPHAAGYTYDLGARVVSEVRATLLAWQRGMSAPHAVV